MRITSGYGVEILKLHKPLGKTLRVCREAVDWLYPVIDTEWDGLSGIRWEKQRFNAAEKLIHTTKRNKAKYAFDTAFPKMPSYLRRAVLQHVLGAVSSARTRSAESREAAASSGTAAGKEKHAKGSQGISNHYMPVFYRDNMYRKEEDRVFLKLYNGKDWVWQEIFLKKTDLDYIRKNWSGTKAKSPVLIKKHRKYFLQFAFEQEAALTERAAGEQRICAVDLGINTDAVCSIMEADGTVAARKFISFAAEKDHLHHVLNRIPERKGLLGLCPEAERGACAEDSRGGHTVCERIQRGRDCVRTSGYARAEDTGKEPAEASYVEETDCAGDRGASGPQAGDEDLESMRVEDKRPRVRRVRKSDKRSPEPFPCGVSERKAVQLRPFSIVQYRCKIFYQGITETRSGNGTVCTGGKSPCSAAQNLMCICGP